MREGRNPTSSPIPHKSISLTAPFSPPRPLRSLRYAAIRPQSHIVTKLFTPTNYTPAKIAPAKPHPPVNLKRPPVLFSFTPLRIIFIYPANRCAMNTLPEVIQADTEADTQLPAVTVVERIQDQLVHLGVPIAKDAETLKNFITNKLIAESMHESPLVRLRALDMLSKRIDIGYLGAPQEIEVAMNVKETNNLQLQLKAKLSSLLNSPLTKPLQPVERVDEKNNV